MAVGNFTPNVLDGDVEKLFKVGTKGVVYLGDEVVEVFIRVPSEEDISSSRLYALREANRLRKEFKDSESDIYNSIIPADLDDMDKEQLISAILYAEMSDIVDEASRNVQVPFPKEPKSNASQEEWEKYVEESEAWPKKYAEAVDKETRRLLETKRKIYSQWNEEDLKKYIIKLIINKYIEAESTSKYVNYLLYRIVFKDDSMKERVFESPEQVADLPVHVRERLIEYYREVATDIGTLKKLPEV